MAQSRTGARTRTTAAQSGAGAQTRTRKRARPIHPQLAADLVELDRLQRVVSAHAIASLEPQLALRLGPSLDDTVKALLAKAQDIIQKYKPAQWAITVGAPLTAQITFTWNL